MQETQETQFCSLGREDTLEEGMATHSTAHRVAKSQTRLTDLAHTQTKSTLIVRFLYVQKDFGRKVRPELVVKGRKTILDI